jgi:hypothetical protein
MTQKGGKWQNLLLSKEEDGIIVILEYEQTHHTKMFHCEWQSARSSHNHLAHTTSDPSNKPSWS